MCHSTSEEEYVHIEKIVAVSNLMLAINSAFNFIIYMLRDPSHMTSANFF